MFYFFGLVASLFLVSPGYATDISGCAQKDADQAMNEIMQLKTWDDLNGMFKKYAACFSDDGAIADGYSDLVGRLLSEDWESLPKLKMLCDSDPAFERFVYKHLDMTIPADAWKLMVDNAKNRCPSDSKRICAEMLKANDALDSEVKAIYADWVPITERRKLSAKEKNSLGYVLVHKRIHKPGINDFYREVNVILLPQNSPIRDSFESEDFRLVGDDSVVLSPDAKKTLVFSYDEGVAARLSVCGDTNCKTTRTACKNATDIGGAAWFSDSTRVAFTQSAVYGEHPGVWIWDTATQVSTQVVKPSDLSKKSTDRYGVFGNVSVSPNGEYVWFVFYTDPEKDNAPIESWVYSLLSHDLKRVESMHDLKHEYVYWAKDSTRIQINGAVIQLDKSYDAVKTSTGTGQGEEKTKKSL